MTGASPARLPRRAAIAGTLALLAACGGTPPAAPPPLPEGWLLAGDAHALRDLAGVVEPLSPTPLRAVVLAAAEATSACAWFEASPSPDLFAIPAALACSEGRPALAERLGGGEHRLWVALPAMEVGRLAGWADVAADGGFVAELTLRDVPAEPPWSVLLPADRAPASPCLAADGALLHAALRPQGGLDLDAAVAEGSEFDRLFKLRSGLFRAAVLEGSFEIAVYQPATGGRVPALAIALPFRVRAAAVAGMEALIEALRRDWPVFRKPLATAAGEGACLPDLDLVPEFGPCYLATDEALVVGWNQATLERALQPGPRPEPPTAGGRVTLDLARFPAADALLATAHEVAPRQGAPLPWRRLTLRQERRDGAVVLALDAQRGGP